MDTQEKLVLSVAEAAKALGMSRQATYDAIQRNEIPQIRIGALVKIPKVQFERMLAGK